MGSSRVVKKQSIAIVNRHMLILRIVRWCFGDTIFCYMKNFLKKTNTEILNRPVKTARTDPNLFVKKKRTDPHWVFRLARDRKWSAPSQNRLYWPKRGVPESRRSVDPVRTRVLPLLSLVSTMFGSLPDQVSVPVEDNWFHLVFRLGLTSLSFCLIWELPSSSF